MTSKSTNFLLLFLFLYAEGQTLLLLDPSIKAVADVQGNTALDLAILNKRELIDVLNVTLEDALNDIAEEGSIPNASTMEENDKYVPVHVEKRNAKPECQADIVNQMAAGVDQTCIHVGNIEAYVDLVMGMVPLHIYYENQTEYSAIFKNFDKDLLTAKSHANIWRNGDSIVKGISRTIDLSREFEPEFRRKYEVNKGRVQHIRDNDDQVQIMEELEADIAILEERKVNTTKMLEHAQNEFIKNFLRADISNIENEINTKRRSLQDDFSIIKELKELVVFLEFVRTDSMRIQEVAVKTRGKLETFRDYLEVDKAAFVRHGRVAKETYTKLEEATVKANKQLTENLKKIKELEAQIEKEKVEIEQKYKVIDDNFQKINKKRREILDKMEKRSSRRGLFGAIGAAVSMFAPPVGIAIAAAGAALYPKGSGNSLDQLEKMAEENAKQAKVIQGNINQKSNEIARLHNTIMEKSDISENLRSDLGDFNSLDGDLKNLSAKTERIVEAVSKALEGVNSIKGIFDEVTLKLGEMIKFATTAKTKAEQQDAKFFIYEKLSSLECNWNDVYIKVGTLDECTKYYRTKYL